MKKGGNPIPRRAASTPSSRTPPTPSTSSSAPTATSTTSTSTAARSARSRPPPLQPTAERLPERPHLDLDDQRLGPVEKDQSNGESPAGDGLTLTLNGTTYAKGLGAHAASDVRYLPGRGLQPLQGERRRGRRGRAARARSSFEVYADATKVYDSGLMTGTTATKTVDVSIAGASELRLVVTDAGDDIDSDHADWALARIECGGDRHHAAHGRRPRPLPTARAASRAASPRPRPSRRRWILRP